MRLAFVVVAFVVGCGSRAQPPDAHRPSATDAAATSEVDAARVDAPPNRRGEAVGALGADALAPLEEELARMEQSVDPIAPALIEVLVTPFQRHCAAKLRGAVTGAPHEQNRAIASAFDVCPTSCPSPETFEAASTEIPRRAMELILTDCAGDPFWPVDARRQGLMPATYLAFRIAADGLRRALELEGSERARAIWARVQALGPRLLEELAPQ